MSRRRCIALLLMAAITVVGSGCAGRGYSGEGSGPCPPYINCYEATGGAKGSLDTTYGANSSCWTTTTAAATACSDTCFDALEALKRAHPDAGC